MPNCIFYPRCRVPASLMPVVCVPTYRTVGVHKPHLDRDLVNDSAYMKAAGHNREMVIRQHEAMTVEYLDRCNEFVKTNKPTYLIGREMCIHHKETYKFTDWFKPSDWKLIQEAGRLKGVIVPEPSLLQIKWVPLGWTPSQEYMEMER